MAVDLDGASSPDVGVACQASVHALCAIVLGMDHEVPTAQSTIESGAPASESPTGCVVSITPAHAFVDLSHFRGVMKRSSLRTIARWLIGVLLFGQLAIAAYACPALHPGAAAEQGEKSSVASLTAQATSMSSCDDSMGATDPASPNLCAEHCKSGKQSDRAPSIVVPVAWPLVLYENLPLAPMAPGPRPMASSLSGLVAASPPHAILHCVRRT